MAAIELTQTLLYVPDVEAAARFYQRVFGLLERRQQWHRSVGSAERVASR